MAIIHSTGDIRNYFEADKTKSNLGFKFTTGDVLELEYDPNNETLKLLVQNTNV